MKKIEFPKFDSARLKTVFADANARATAAREQAVSRGTEIVRFQQDNLAALKSAGEIVAAGARPLADEAVANTRKQIESLTGTVKSLRAAKSPAELVKLQREAAKASLATMRDDNKALGQSFAKLATDAFEPLKGRVAAVSALREKLAA